MSIANGLALPNPLSNGTTADAVQVMGDFNYLLAVANRALLDAGGGAGMNAQSTQIHNLANGTSANDAVNLSQLSGYALLSGAAFTGAISTTGALAAAGVVNSGNETVAGTLGVTGNATFTGGLGAASSISLTTNNQPLYFTDVNGGRPYFIAQNDNNFVFFATDGSGASRPIWSTIMHNSSSVFQVNPGMTVGGTLGVTGAFTANGGITATGALSTGQAANCVGYLGVPSNAKTTSYTLALSDMGLGVDFNGASLTCTIPANASVAFPVGTVILITNLNSSALSIAITSDTLTMSGTTSTGTRTLGQNGEARLRKVTATSWLIGGTNLS